VTLNMLNEYVNINESKRIKQVILGISDIL